MFLSPPLCAISTTPSLLPFFGSYEASCLHSHLAEEVKRCLQGKYNPNERLLLTVSIGVGDEDGGWARLAGCPYGVQGNNRWGRVTERPHHRSWHRPVSSGSALGGWGCFRTENQLTSTSVPCVLGGRFPAAVCLEEALGLFTDKYLIETRRKHGPFFHPVALKMEE